MREPRTEPRQRGVRLSDLDRGLVYRIAFVGRRWEVLGPDAPESSGDACAYDGERAGGPRTAYVPRHAAPAATVEGVPQSPASRPDGQPFLTPGA
uniref:Uncharacterized protein n=1 Tax=uncultured prokaryote TaxID=198431 RepID=A0A0H5Q227_9ZZZZ|nr:hypothetical protein [uncultured prokaryote]